MITRHAKVLTPDGFRPVADLEVGDLVQCYGGFNSLILGIRTVKDTRTVVNDLYTLDHEVVADFSHFESLYFVYLERQGRRFRLGMGCPHTAWLLDWFAVRSHAEVKLRELSDTFNIPRFDFDNQYWLKHPDNVANGQMMLSELLLCPDYPQRLRFDGPVPALACNLLTGVLVNGAPVASYRMDYEGLLYDIKVNGHLIVQ